MAMKEGNTQACCRGRNGSRTGRGRVDSDGVRDVIRAGREHYDTHAMEFLGEMPAIMVFDGKEGRVKRSVTDSNGRPGLRTYK